MSTNNDIRQGSVFAHVASSTKCEGPPSVDVHDGAVNVWPAGKGRGPYFAIGINRWLDIVALAGAAIADSADYSSCSGAVANVGSDL